MKNFEYNDMLFWMPEELAKSIITGKTVTNPKCFHAAGSYFFYTVFKDGSAKILPAHDWYGPMYRALMEGVIPSIDAAPPKTKPADVVKVVEGMKALGITSAMVAAYEK